MAVKSKRDKKDEGVCGDCDLASHLDGLLLFSSIRTDFRHTRLGKGPRSDPLISANG